ncbi:RsmE family RNA methyltransferase [bacterium]|nr:RsmE family RNA methyltransferase [bacterium]
MSVTMSCHFHAPVVSGEQGMAQIEVYHADAEAIRFEQREAVLSGSEAHHLLRVRRGKPGDVIRVVDGAGNAYEGRLRSVEGEQARIELTSHESNWNEPPAPLHLGCGLLKGDAMFQALDHAVQGGATAVTPLSSRYSIAKWNEKKHARGRRVLHAGMKQCGRGLCPTLHPAKPYHEWCIEQAEAGIRVLFDQDGDDLPDLSDAGTVSVAIGPEGGFSTQEVDRFVEQGFRLVRLGPRRLRAETSVIAALAVMRDVSGR